MEASEAGRRIFWRHRWLLIILMILPAVGVFGLKEHFHHFEAFLKSYPSLLEALHKRGFTNGCMLT